MEVHIMKKVAVIKFINPLIQGSYINPKNYNFLTDIEDLQPGDIVVVDTVNGLQVAEFVKYNELGLGETGVKTPTKWVVQKIDLSAHEARIEAAERAAKLKVMMEERRKKTQELEIYEILAKADPEMAKLLEEFKKLQEVL
jgi:hypothetical protein